VFEEHFMHRQIKIKSNQFDFILFMCDQKLTKSQFNPTHGQTKKDNGKTKTKNR